VSEFKIKFQQFLSIEPEIDVANVYVMSVFIRDDFNLLHFLSAFKIVRVRIVIFEDIFESLDFIICQPDVSVAN
jgi:hypothetical protein